MKKYYIEHGTKYKKIKTKKELPPTQSWICALFHGSWEEILYFIKADSKIGLDFTTIIKCHKCKGKYKTSWIN
ncbi:MAG: hypothetical protein ACW98F_00140 [Candidatus Hodarchaeales archaeon]|jgi:hypothetical protein